MPEPCMGHQRRLRPYAQKKGDALIAYGKGFLKLFCQQPLISSGQPIRHF